MTQIGYADFIRVLNVYDPLDWVPGLEVRMDASRQQGINRLQFVHERVKLLPVVNQNVNSIGLCCVDVLLRSIPVFNTSGKY